MARIRTEGQSRESFSQSNNGKLAAAAAPAAPTKINKAHPLDGELVEDGFELLEDGELPLLREDCAREAAFADSFRILS